MTDPLPPLAHVIRQYELFARKTLGQHFLLDPHLIAKVAACAGDLKGHHVIEIGPGPGGLTRVLLAAGAKQVVAVEKDARCVRALGDLASHYEGILTVVEHDALETDLTALTPSPRKIVANLPYNIGTPLLLQWLDAISRQGKDAFTSLTLMFQKEVARRIVAPPGGKDYGRLSVMTQWLCEVEWHFDLPPGAFSPPPKVPSTSRPR